MIIETKLYIPETKGTIISRPHLNRRLDEGLTNKLTLITSPAGYGKSTLLSEWAKQLNMQVAWVSFDENDNDVLYFWNYVIESMNKNISIIDKQLTLHSIDRDSSGYTLVAMLINQFNRINKKIVLVWDDFHTINNAMILQGVNYLIERLPRHVHIYIASRTQPHLSLARLRVEGSLHELQVDDLRFDMDETKAFFHYCTNTTLNREAWEKVYERTEGWVAGMKVAALSLGEANKRELGTKNTFHFMTGKHQNIADYFLEEVFLKQTIEIQQFLMKTSLLDRINGSLAEKITGCINGRAIINQLEQMNLFFISLDNAREWYRYHHLFQQFLQLQLQTNASETMHDLNNKAAQWFEENGFLKEALNHYLKGENFTKALQLLETYIPTLPHYERNTLYKWLNNIPKDLLIQYPLLFLTNAASLFLSGFIDEATSNYWWAVEQLDQQANSFTIKAQQQLNAGLNFLVAFRSFLERDFESLIVYSERYLEIESSGDLLVNFGSERDGYHPAWNVYISDGRLDEAEKALQKLLPMWEHTNNKPFYAHLCIDYGKLLYERNELEEAKRYINEALHIGEKNDNVNIIVRASLLLAQMDEVEHRFKMVDTRIDQLQKYVSKQQHSTLIRQIAIFRVQLALNRQENELWLPWLQKYNLSFEDEITAVMLDDYSVLVRMLYIQGKIEEAILLINRLLLIADREAKYQKKLRFSLYKSLLLFKQNHIIDSYELLEELLAIAEKEQYVRTFLDEGIELKHLLSEYIVSVQNHHYKSGKKVSFQYAKRLLQLMTMEERMSPEKNNYFVYNKALLTRKETIVLSYMERGFSNKAIANELHISLATVKTHIHHIYRKLEVNNRLLAIEKAKKLGIL